MPWRPRNLGRIGGAIALASPLLAGFSRVAGAPAAAPAGAPLHGRWIDSAALAPCACAEVVPWVLWQRYAETFISAEGRVVEPSAGDRTTSEGQAYALFFALVANDRPRFERLLAWTRDNLARGDLARNLPGWHWGKDDLGRWRQLDPASASDADLWLAYALLEAGRLWREPGYDRLARSIVAQAATREVAKLPRLGPMLLPGPVGFEPKKGVLWRLNPSYLPLQLLRRFAAAKLPGPWGDLAATTVRLVRETSPHGFVPDWVGLHRDRGLVPDPVAGSVASYDAIRVYLWAGMLPASEPLRAPLLVALGGPARAIRQDGVLSERIDARRGDAQRGDADAKAPPGFYAAVLPMALADGDQERADRLRRTLGQSLHDGLYGGSPAYYDQNLALFARGFDEGRFEFDAGGALSTEWEKRCCAH